MTTSPGDDTMVGTTTRPVTFGLIDHATRRCLDTCRMPAGTTVYARPRRQGDGLNIRIPGTLFTQHVPGSAVDPA